ncbi:MAG: Smr/MutS family protein [Gammaproteobacteria bacterium]|nr:Smr/MutS family protein [Gammaproteobacteria bacterium]MBU1722320.1 Smr/MutS family protein [Gammaproteobacteria bacterium]MBU2006437.1 Smr/MutS family protein [Gammaproteobacteria bacterium]
MQDVTPLRPSNQVVHDNLKPPAIPVKTIADEQQVIIDMLSDEYDPVELQPGDMLSYCRPGIQHKIFRKLRSGQYRIASELDLHGLNARGAKQMLLEFLHEAHPGIGECVRIIHGKGNRSAHNGPVIKTKINNWLRQHDRVLAFHTARPVDGGTGAIYVLLRR